MRTPKAGEIYRAKRAVLGKVSYARPFLVLRVNKLDADICYFSTKFDLIDPADLTINELDSGFESTGRDETSYLIYHSIDAEPFEFFDEAKFLGTATDVVLETIEDWWGAPLENRE
ncbi:MAG TPA: hypothetical protein VKX17_15850 [Planctomycetota bacterium]|nr:hypothetical protein [Planctomycetota bacterium]